MILRRPTYVSAATLAVALLAATLPASAQSASRDRIKELLETAPEASQEPAAGNAKAGQAGKAVADKAAEVAPPDPRAGEQNYEQAKALMLAIDQILNDSARSARGRRAAAFTR